MAEICACLTSWISDSKSPINSHYNLFSEICSSTVSFYSPTFRIGNYNFPISPLFIFAAFLIFFGGYIRISARSALGTLFRYELSIRDSHKLVTTGPYAYVRHPSYTGGALLSIGHAIFMYTPGTLLNECLDTYAMIRWLRRGILVSRLILPAWAVLWRCDEEDKMLHKEFGKEWDRWADKIRYKVIPYIF